jgi:hypothetical protein
MVMRRVLAAAAVALLLFAVGLSVRSVHRDGFSCGSLVKPRSLEQRGPVGTNLAPCQGAHDAERVIALTLVAAAGLTTALVVVTGSRDEG